MQTVRWLLLASGVVSAFALLGCSSRQADGTSASAAAFANVAPSSPSAVGHLHAELALVGQPAVTADGKSIFVAVNVTNDGPATFGSTTEPHNVNLGAHSVDAAGKVVDNDLARGHLPQVASGATVKATILLPVAATVGHRVELLPVQEGIGWFDQWGTKALIVGPFEACNAPAEGKVCDANGKPLPVIPASP